MGRHRYTKEEINSLEARINETSLEFYAAKILDEKEEALRLKQTLIELALDRYLNTAKYYQDPAGRGMNTSSPNENDSADNIRENEVEEAEDYDGTDGIKQRSCGTPSYYGENEHDIIVDKILSSIESFDPACGEKLCHLISYAIKRAEADIFQAPGENHVYTVKGKGSRTQIKAEFVPIDKPVEGKDGEEMGMDEILADPSASVECSSILGYDDLVADIINYIKSPGQKITDTKRNWFTLFFTENITYTAQNGITQSRKEKSIFSAMELPYLDFYMSEVCRTLQKIAYTELKTYGEIQCEATKAHSPEQQIHVPIQADVSEAYITTYQISMNAEKNSRSKFLKDYRAVVAELTRTADQ